MAISSPQQKLLPSLNLCKYPFPLSLPNFHSLSPPKHALQREFSLLRAQVTHFETKTSTNFTTNGKSPSGLSNSGAEHNRVAEKIGGNSFGLLERKIFEKGSSMSTAINSVGEDKRVVEKFVENSDGLVKSRNLGNDAAPVNHFETKISSINGKSPSQYGGENKRVVKENGNGVGIVERRNLEKGSGKRREFGFGVSPVTKIFSSSTNNCSTTGKFPSGLSDFTGEEKRAVKKYGENGVGVAEREIFEKGFSTSTTINCSTDVKYPSGLSNSGGENKRVVEKIGGNGVGLVERRKFEKGSRKRREIGPGVSPRSSRGEIFVEKLHNEIVKTLKNGMDDEIGEDGVGLVERRDFRRGSRKWREFGSVVSPRSSKGKNFLKKLNNEIGKKSKKSVGVDKENIGKRDKKSKLESPGLIFRVGLDMCSKNGDVMGALKLYDKAQLEDIELRQYHYTVLLYLCSSAAIGVVSPAKSGTGSRSLSNGEVSTLNLISSNEIGKKFNCEVGNAQSNNHVTKNGKLIDSDRVGGLDCQLSNESNRLWRDDDCELAKVENDNNPQNKEIRVSDDLRKDALKRGFEIYERMRLEKVPMNEASLTSIARMALAMGDGDMAFDMVKQMTELGINPRLRSYGPALSAFCNSGNIDKAFLVEKHMLEHGVCPEEPELEALLRVCLEGNRSDKVYYLLHKLRTNVRQVSHSTADLLENWFTSDAASKVGKRKWDERELRKTIEKGSGGWHGKGWLGKGKWTISKTSVGEDGVCKCCGENLATIDLDPVETEKFAESVASIAAKREKKLSFQQFQKWLDYYGPFEAVVDAANIGLLTQRKFKPSKVNAVVNGIRHMLPSKKWPLIVLHNRRVTDDIMDKPMNKAILEKWKNADALYATPTGSNDDWYWLYAAIKFKCLLVTNDEMRDHLFQLLGNDFFPRWKERHQVHFSFSEVGPVFHMPPPCSVVIQESEKGHWHIPIASEHEFKEERKWLCVVRDKSEDRLKSAATLSGSDISDNGATESRDYQTNTSTTIVSSKYSTILPNIEAAEKLGGCVVDFQI